MNCAEKAKKNSSSWLLFAKNHYLIRRRWWRRRKNETHIVLQRWREKSCEQLPSFFESKIYDPKMAALLVRGFCKQIWSNGTVVVKRTLNQWETKVNSNMHISSLRHWEGDRAGTSRSSAIVFCKKKPCMQLDSTFTHISIAHHHLGDPFACIIAGIDVFAHNSGSAPPHMIVQILKPTRAKWRG